MIGTDDVQPVLKLLDDIRFVLRAGMYHLFNKILKSTNQHMMVKCDIKWRMVNLTKDDAHLRLDHDDDVLRYRRWIEMNIKMMVLF